MMLSAIWQQGQYTLCFGAQPHCCSAHWSLKWAHGMSLSRISRIPDIGASQQFWLDPVAWKLQCWWAVIVSLLTQADGSDWSEPFCYWLTWLSSFLPYNFGDFIPLPLSSDLLFLLWPLHFKFCDGTKTLRHKTAHTDCVKHKKQNATGIIWIGKN